VGVGVEARSAELASGKGNLYLDLELKTPGGKREMANYHRLVAGGGKRASYHRMHTRRNVWLGRPNYNDNLTN
jgi:hypothetical protein